MITFSFAELNLVLDYPANVVFEDFYPPTYRLFCKSGGFDLSGAEPFRIELRAGDTARIDLTPGPVLCRNGECWALHKQGNSYYLVVWPSHRTGPVSVTHFTKDVNRARIIYNESLAAERIQAGRPVTNPFDYPVDRMLVMSLLTSRGGLLCHAAGACFGGKGYVFTGLSGSGKSTLSTLLLSRPGWSVLSDERVAIRGKEAPFRVFGTPWAGDAGLASATGCDLAAIFFLRHGEEDRLEPLARSEALLRFLSLLTISWYDPDRMPEQLRVVEQMVSALPCYELSFRPSPDVVEILTSLATS